MNTAINLADLVRAAGELLPANRKTLDQVAALLGFEPLPLVGAAPVTSRTPPASPVTPEPPPGPPAPSGVAPVSPPSAGSRPAAAGSLAFRLDGPTAAPVTSTPPAWYVEIQEPLVTTTRPSPAPAPLLAPQWVRTTLMRTAAVPVAEGRVDVARLAATLARLQLPRTIPREPTPTLRFGAQVLVDVGDALLPYRHDQRQVVQALRRLLGSQFFEAWQFQGTPARGVQPLGSRQEPQPYRPPPTGTPVLVLGDLGMAPPHFTLPAVTLGEWRQFAAMVRDSGRRLVACVPYGPARWPAALHGLVELRYWGHAPPQPHRQPAPPWPVGESEAALATAALARLSPDVFELARLLALASRIELDLLRAARQALLPQADAGTEADLWFSALVEYQAGSTLFLRPDVADDLRQSLQASGRLEEAWQFLTRYRQKAGAPDTIQLEERVAYLVTRDGAAAQPAVEHELSRVLATLHAQTADPDGLALWALEALAHLPPAVQTWPAARDLQLAAGLRLGVRVLAAADLPADPAVRRWLLPADLLALPAGEGTTLGVLLQPEGLVLREPAQLGDQPLPDVPPTLPRVVTVTWPDETTTARQVIQLYPNQTSAPLPLGRVPTASLELLDGRRYTLVRELDLAALAGNAPAAQVEALDLHGLGLSAVPPAVFDFPNLRTLDLRDNQIRELPARLNRLRGLRELLLDNNPLASLPDEIGHQLPHLTRLSLRSTGQSELPESLAKLAELVDLDLADNTIDEFPPAVTHLRRLQRLDLAGNAIGRLPSSIGRLSGLSELVLERCELVELPPVIGKLPQLSSLSLAHNELTSLPIDIGFLPRLQTLDLTGNLLRQLPETLGQLVTLHTLNLASNQLAELPLRIGQLQGLARLDLRGNQLTTLPDTLAALGATLTYLDLRDNFLSQLPADLLARVAEPRAILETCFSTSQDQFTAPPPPAYADPWYELFYEVSLPTGATDRYTLRVVETLLYDGRSGTIDGPREFTLDQRVLTSLESNPQAYGQLLGKTLFASTAESLHNNRTRAGYTAAPLSVRLHLDPRAGALHRLRWETLHDLEGRSLLPQADIVFAREATPERAAQGFPTPQPPRALVVTSATSDAVSHGSRSIEFVREGPRANEALGAIPNTSLAFGPVTHGRLAQALRDGFPIVYLEAEAVITTSEAGLRLADEDGRSVLVSFDQLAATLAAAPVKPLVVLGVPHADLWQLAVRLLQAGLPAVLYFQTALPEPDRTTFLTSFFHQLARHGRVDGAVAAARRALTDQALWWAPVLYTALRDGQLFDVLAAEPSAGAETVAVAPDTPLTFDWVEIPAGSFPMGSDRGRDHQASDDELPQHRVDVPAFRMARVPVTVAQFAAFVAAAGYTTTAEEAGAAYAWNGSSWAPIEGASWRAPGGPKTDVSGKQDHPVTCVSWHDAMAFCRWAGVRLPTEAEWEKAARGADGRIYPWGDTTPDPDHANFGASVDEPTPAGEPTPVGEQTPVSSHPMGEPTPEGSHPAGDTTPVHSHPAGASPYGVLDMAGNAWEWTTSLWGEDGVRPAYPYPYDPADGREDLTAADPVRRVLRGGSCIDDARHLRCAKRHRYAANAGVVYVGFRVATLNDELSIPNPDPLTAIRIATAPAVNEWA